MPYSITGPPEHFVYLTAVSFTELAQTPIEQSEKHPVMEEEIVETPEEQLAKQHRKEKKDLQGS